MPRVLSICPTDQLLGALRAHHKLPGLEILTCEGGVEAVRLLRRRAIDVVLTDPVTPIAEDLALAREIGAVRPGVRVIVLAPSTAPEDVIEALRASVFACFSAPLDHRDVADMVATALAEDHWQNGIEVVSGLPRWMTLRVSCRLLTAERLVRFMTEYRSDVPSDDRDLLMTAFREMLINAMEHGAGFDPEKVVEVTAARTARTIVFHFRDPGSGFDRDDLAHAAKTSTPEDVLASAIRRADEGRRPGGFGMLLVKQIADELIYNERGNEVIMIKHTA
jgi:anti-sigma regulatory factor (Ser/Thr protein kinase)